MKVNITGEPIEVFVTKEAADQELHVYAETLRNLGMTEEYGVQVQPVSKTRFDPTWGIFVRRR